MAQHFLLSAGSRTLSLKAIYKAGEAKAYETFCKMRWPETDGEAVCPRCGFDQTYFLKTRRKYECKACKHHFSVTSGTIFHARKLDFTDLLAAICIIVNSAKGVSAVQLSRDLDVQYKTAFVLAHKLREAMGDETDRILADGVAEIDGAYFGGHVRPANLRENRKDRRLKRHQTGTRRVVVAIRDRDGRTLTTVTRRESEGLAFAMKRIKPGTVVHADEATHWDALEDSFPTYRINHSEAYSLNGACTNQAESFFSRLRRMIEGQHHGVSPKHLHAYATHAAWLEDHRREANGTLAGRALQNALWAPVSRTWAGYWQRANG
ncbi:IS1595 family transposase [Parvularcula oceani]|uniref:IS1595 family transposase n=1 Tax=Parvularcula oceani TaxID=1247963 RepID=UPI0004E11CFB|nr:IS1595 family transposase [Parvularcula oceani]